MIGSTLAARFRDRMSAALAGHAVPAAAAHAITGSFGGALTAAGRAGGALGQALA